MKKIDANSNKIKKRFSVSNLVTYKKITLKQAGEILCLSYSRTKYLYARYKQEGLSGLEHKGKGKQSNHCIHKNVKQAILLLYKSKYADCSLSLAVELLKTNDSFVISRETLRQWLIADNIPYTHIRRRPYRRFYKRSDCFGALLQLTVYNYNWIQSAENGARQCLLGLCDNATNIKLFHMTHHSSIHSAMTILQIWIKKYGIPQGIYISDELFVKNKHLKIVLANLGIELQTPKGGAYFSTTNCALTTLGYRLVCEMKVQGIATIQEANVYILEVFCVKINKKLSRQPEIHENAHVLCDESQSIDKFFYFFFTKKVKQNKCIIIFKKKYFLLNFTENNTNESKFVQIKRFLDGSIKIYQNKTEINYEILE